MIVIIKGQARFLRLWISDGLWLFHSMDSIQQRILGERHSWQKYAALFSHTCQSSDSQPQMASHTHTHTHTHTHSLSLSLTHTHTRTHPHTLSHLHTHTKIHTHTNVHAHTHTHTLTHDNTQEIFIYHRKNIISPVS